MALLSRVLAGVPKLPGALCRNHPGPFGSDAPDDTAAAVEICRTCPELAACRTWASKQHKLFGVVAGAVHHNAEKPTKRR